MSKNISAENLYSVYPPVLKNDELFSVLGELLSEQLVNNREMCNKLIIYAALDKMSEELLDALAIDFNVEWYDFDGSIEEKRNTIKECISIHQYKGTKYAVETALQSVYTSAKVHEWYDYGGEPYHFKVVINDSSNDTAKRSRILAKVKYYKNLRSVLEETVFQIGINSDIPVRTATGLASIHKQIGTNVNNYGTVYHREYTVDPTIRVRVETDSFKKTIATQVKNSGVIYHVSHSADIPVTLGIKSGSLYKKIYTEVTTYGME